MNKLALLLLVAVYIITPYALHADTLDKIKFLRISEEEGKAVIKGSNGKLRMVGVGDVIDGDQQSAVNKKGKQRSVRPRVESWQQSNAGAAQELRIVEIVKDRVVLERQTDQGPETIIVRLVNGTQSVERLTKRPPKQPGMPVQVPGKVKQK